MRSRSLLLKLRVSMLSISISGAWNLAIAGESPSIHHDRLVETSMLVQPKVERINPGFNPEFFGYRIQGLVLKGANDCAASGATVAFQSAVENGVLFITPTRNSDAEFDRICPSLSQPIFELAHLDVRYSRKEVQKIIIRNVGEELEDMAINP